MKNAVILFVVLSVCTLHSFAHTENVFIQRSYWKKQPSIEKIQEDMARGNDISELGGHKFDAVTWAILEKNPLETISFLLDQEGNEPNKITHDQRTYVFWAAYKGNYELMLDLIQRGARMDLKDQFGYSVLTFSAVTGQTDQRVYDLCITHGAQIATEKNSKGADVLLMVSPFLESQDQLDYFLNKGLNLKTKDNEGNNLFVYAASTGNQFMMKKALEVGLSANVNNGKAAYFAAKGTRFKKNDANTFKFLKKQGVSFQFLDQEGNNLLHILASKRNYSDGIKYLVDEGVDLNAQNSEGKTPLMIAMESTTPENIRLLAEMGADFSISDKDGNTAIHAAIKNDDHTIIPFILSEYSEGINTSNNNGLTPLHFAAMTATDFSPLKQLIEHGADVTIKTPFDESVYDLAKENEQLNLTDEQLNSLKNEN